MLFCVCVCNNQRIPAGHAPVQQEGPHRSSHLRMPMTPGEAGVQFLGLAPDYSPGIPAIHIEDVTRLSPWPLQVSGG